MTINSILEITNGVTTVNLLSERAGFLLDNWTPAVATGKGGGVFQSSSLSTGRRLVHRVFGNADETFELKVRDRNQDATIREAQNLVRLLESALAYWNEEDPRTIPVYIRAKGPCETNIRYALIHYYEIPQLDNPYAQPFFSASKLAAMDGFNLNLERGHWTSQPPGGDECTFISSFKSWRYGGFEISHSHSDVGSTFKIYNDELYAGGFGHIFKYDGETWTDSLDIGGGSTFTEMEVFRGALYAILSNGALYRLLSGAWSLVGTPFSSPVRIHAYNNALYVADGDTIYRSTSGSGWSVDLTATGEDFRLLEAHSPMEIRQGLGLLPGAERLYAVSTSTSTLYTRKLASEGTGWRLNQGIRTPLGSVTATVLEMFGGPDHFLYMGGDVIEEVIFRSVNGYTWVEGFTVLRETVSAELGPGVHAIIHDGNFFWAASADVLRVSKDGKIWTVYDNTSFTTITPRGLAYYDNRLFLMDFGAGDILVSADIDMGREETEECVPAKTEVYIANKSNIANLTHVKISDGGVFTDLFPMLTFPVDLLPASPAVNDAVYFGISTAATLQNTGPFSSLVFDLIVNLAPGEELELAIEYWNGAWTTLTTTDNTLTFSNSRLGKDGPGSIHWVPPSDWTTTAVDSVTGWWVRLRVTGGSPVTPPQQDNRNVYTVVCPFVNIAGDVIDGEIDALGRILVQNVSDLDGPGGSAPNLYQNRVVVGVKEYDSESGQFFDAYLNASDTQNPVGVSVSLGTNTTFVSDVATPTGRRATYNPTGVESMDTRVTFELSPTIARDFYGTYHLFLRGRRTGGSASDFDVQVEIATGSGGISFVTQSKQFQTTTAFEVLDFGQITIPASAFLSYKELGDLSEIRVQASAANAAIDLYVYDIILIPTGLNRFSCDAYDKTNTATSEIGASGANPKFLDLDSTTDPRNQVRALVKDLNQQATAIYNPVTPHEVTLKANRAQKLWFFALRTSATGSSYNWIAEPWITNAVQIYHNARYLTMRGAE